LFEKTVNSTLTETSTTLHINDDKEKVALIYSNGTTTNVRFQLTNHLGSSALELDENRTDNKL